MRGSPWNPPVVDVIDPSSHTIVLGRPYAWNMYLFSCGKCMLTAFRIAYRETELKALEQSTLSTTSVGSANCATRIEWVIISAPLLSRTPHWWWLTMAASISLACSLITALASTRRNVSGTTIGRTSACASVSFSLLVFLRGTPRPPNKMARSTPSELWYAISMRRKTAAIRWPRAGSPHSAFSTSGDHPEGPAADPLRKDLMAAMTLSALTSIGVRSFPSTTASFASSSWGNLALNFTIVAADHERMPADVSSATPRENSPRRHSHFLTGL